VTASVAALVRQPGSSFAIEQIQIADDLRPGEVLVEVHAAGICHTDVTTAATAVDAQLPIVLGHEAAGVVAGVGSAVTRVAVGDRVALSFASCGSCRYCTSGQPSYCVNTVPLNLSGGRPDGSTPLTDAGGAEVRSFFFGQSSFGRYAVTYERNCVPIGPSIDFSVAAAMGCGFQTGAGTLLRALKVRPGSSVAVFGVGTVGLSALMAARLAGADTVVAIDPMPARRELALELGATAALDAADDVPAAIRGVVTDGVDYAVDCVGHQQVLTSALASLAVRGACATIGMSQGWGPNPVQIDLTDVLLRGLTIRGVLEGDSVPEEFIPELISYVAEGRFPVDRLVSEFPFERIDDAVAAIKAGKVVKPVLTFS
jgi:aryl-alcohol dehydrogenase